MLRKACLLHVGFLLTLFLGSSGPGASEGAAQPPRLGIDLHSGVYAFDEGGLHDYFGEEVAPDLSFGARAVARIGSAWEVEIGYGFSAVQTSKLGRARGICSQQPCAVDVPLVRRFQDLNVHTYYGAVSYRVPVSTGFRLFVSAGGGGVRLVHEERGSLSDPVVLLGVGLAYPLSEQIELRSDVRDFMQICARAGQPFGLRDVESACPLDDELLHNLEFSGGVRFWIR